MIVYDEDMLRYYMDRAVDVSPERPILIDKFLEDAESICLQNARFLDSHGVAVCISEKNEFCPSCHSDECYFLDSCFDNMFLLNLNKWLV